jgi:hypothetical protein
MSSKTPSFNYKRWQDRRTRVYTACISNAYLLGQVLDPDSFTDLVVLLRRALKMKRAHESVIRDSLLEFGGVEMTEEVCDRIAVKISGGYDEIRAGKSIVSSNAVPTSGSWMPIEVAEMRFDSVRNHKAQVRMTALVLTGALSGRMFSQLMPAKATSVFFANNLGWAKFGPRPAHSELVQMKFTGLVVDDKRNGLQVDEYKCTAGQLQINKKLREWRGEPCILEHRYQCKTCPIGYSKCPRGTHRYTWVPRFCSQCKDERAIFDPAESNVKICLLCRSKGARSTWAQERRGVT